MIICNSVKEEFFYFFRVISIKPQAMIFSTREKNTAAIIMATDNKALMLSVQNCYKHFKNVHKFITENRIILNTISDWTVIIQWN